MMLFPCKRNHGPTGTIAELPPLLPPSPYGTALHVAMGGSPVVLMAATDATEFLVLVSSTGEALESTLNAIVSVLASIDLAASIVWCPNMATFLHWQGSSVL